MFSQIWALKLNMLIVTCTSHGSSQSVFSVTISEQITYNLLYVSISPHCCKHVHAQSIRHDDNGGESHVMCCSILLYYRGHVIRYSRWQVPALQAAETDSCIWSCLINMLMCWHLVVKAAAIFTFGHVDIVVHTSYMFVYEVWRVTFRKPIVSLVHLLPCASASMLWCR